MQRNAGGCAVGATPQQHHGRTSSADELAISVDPDELDCPICFHTLRPPVFQCAAGHVLCSSCHDRLRQGRRCPVCSVATGFNRCYIVERILRSVRVPCPNAARGCGVQTSLHEREEHENACAYSYPLRHGLATVTINENPKAGAVVRMGPCGGSGDHFRKMHMVSEARRIVRIAIRHASAVDAIRVLYARGGRNRCKETETDWWGWDGGKLTVFRLRRNEYLTSVEGHYSHFNGYVVIRSLKFVSNLRTYGPFGKECGVRFALPAGAGGRILGFHARSGQYLDAIGTYVKMDDRAS